ncbi:diadenylate cyclase CdaA [Desulfoscipio gibsoniae]|uniref:Diadenylate cyclase n=1 Tax=Desulfoscipio gibsoniae DSM 7213 TaxID=767817 RepID=R4KER4_9FIRM|nr:diadenylate cyclase CdaA [Desulfoscipio gibsoniae]AGL00162.1 TIGR00159 family protein [Desulfoscipio gibsoniae DSM 7213]
MEYLRALKDNLNINLDVFNIVSIIDILIVAFVLYRLMLLIQGTRAVQLIKGMVVLLVATAASSLLNLNTVHWLLRYTMTGLLVALPIVFQPELRRALEKLGGGDFFARPLTQMAEGDRSALINEVVRAALSMSATRTGALIVLERSTGLQELIETGVKVDGIVSAELLMNIFITKSPLHDGAAIIRGDRLAAAACVLPLSESRELSRELGTRHRAAVGLTEQSDAVAVVVSEETGNVSMAMEGTLYRRLNEAGLHELLVKYLQPTTTRSAFSSLWQRR